MIVEASVTINGSKAAVWAVITDIEHAAEIMSGIDKIEIVEEPASGLIGLKWRETRMLFGKPAAVEKWITEAKENDFYTTRAVDGGFVFLTTNCISGSDGVVTLTGTHENIPQGFVARLKSLPMVFFKGVIKKAILQDLKDIKAVVERRAIAGSNGPPKDNLESWQYINSFMEEFLDDEYWTKWKPMARGIVGALEARGLAPMFRIGQSMHTIILSTSPHFGLTPEQLRVRLDFYPNEQTVHVAYGPGRPEIEERVALSNALPRVLHYLQRLWSETKAGVQIPDALSST